MTETSPRQEALQLVEFEGITQVEAAQRLGLPVSAWVVNQSLTPLDVIDPVLRARRSHEAVYLRELAAHGRRTASNRGMPTFWLPNLISA